MFYGEVYDRFNVAIQSENIRQLPGRFIGDSLIQDFDPRFASFHGEQWYRDIILNENTSLIQICHDHSGMDLLRIDMIKMAVEHNKLCMLRVLFTYEWDFSIYPAQYYTDLLCSIEDAETFNVAIELFGKKQILIGPKVLEKACCFDSVSIEVLMRVYGESPIQWRSRAYALAVESGNLDGIDVLLFHEVPIETLTSLATQNAVKRNDLDLLEKLYDRGFFIDGHCVQIAIRQRNEKIFKWLFNRKCEITQESLDMLVGWKRMCKWVQR